MVYLNDQNYSSYRFEEVELLPLMPDAQVRGVKQEILSVIKAFTVGISMLDDTVLESIQLMQSKRSMIFYTNWFIIHGNMHVNPDQRDDDIFDETRDFFFPDRCFLIPVTYDANPSHSQGSIYGP